MPVDDLVFDYVNGTLGPVERAAFERELSASSSLRSEVADVAELLAGLAFALPTPAPSAGLRDRVLRTAQVGSWAPFVALVARVWDLSVAAVQQEFQRAVTPESWGPGPMPGISLFHLEGGPAAAGADVGIVIFEPGTAFPHHGHTSSESYVVLQGRIFDSSGRVELPGDVIAYTEDTIHSFTTDPDQPTVIALVLRGELRILG